MTFISYISIRMSFPPSGILPTHTMARSPVSLISLMDRELRRVIAKVRV